MEPLSPRPINVPSRSSKPMGSKTFEDPKASVRQIARQNRERNHPQEPPEYLQEPQWPDGEDGKKYRLKKLLGKGGFALCYEAELRPWCRTVQEPIVAIKIVKRLHPAPKMMEKFKSELQIHSKLRHPNIVEFHRAFTSGESTHVVLGLCPNGSLMDMVKARKSLTEPESRRYIIQLSGAIKYMHERNVIHRDLKMGNIFLDKDLNVKIGDFGLAALLISDAEISFNRRRTMCGTPNYIAPEVLEKSKNGHDYKVDIWSLGVIIFAMLAGYPPFQAKTTDEIYKKVRAREYQWPSVSRCSNHISQSAKDLVAELLVEADDRPEPDDVVSHEFLRSGYVHQELPPNALYTPPPAPIQDFTSTTPQDVWRMQWSALCEKCGVGWMNSRQAFPTVGDNTAVTVYTECQYEEGQGRTPVVPLPENQVYIPVFKSRKRPKGRHSNIDLLRMIPEAGAKTGSKISVPSVPDVFPKQRQESLPRPGPARARPDKQAVGQIQTIKGKTEADADSEVFSTAIQTSSNAATAAPLAPKTAATRTQETRNENGRIGPTKTSLLLENPIRPSSSARSDAQTFGGSVRLTRSRTAQAGLRMDGRQPGVPPPKPVSSQTLPTRSRAKALKSSASEQQIPLRSASSRTGEKDQAQSLAPSGTRSNFRSQPQPNLIDPAEHSDSISSTSTHDTRMQLRRLVRELQSALDGTAREVKSTRQKRPPAPMVVKWVDYSNKFGVGYILTDGSIGCLFNAEDMVPCASIVVRAGEAHKNNRKIQSYKEKHEYVPTSGKPIEFYENRWNDGIKKAKVAAREFAVDSAGKLELLSSSSYENAKRRRVVLFDKFANFLVGGSPVLEQHGSEDHQARACDTFAKFYQRLGDIGIWGFGDGSFQFNFPDHTKVVMSADGTQCDFYHLSEEAARHMRQTGKLKTGALERRGLLSLPIQSLVRGRHGSRGFENITTENEFKEKILFIQSLFQHWIANGGMGCVKDPLGFKWDGNREIVQDGKERLVWVTVGAAGGDRPRLVRSR